MKLGDERRDEHFVGPKLADGEDAVLIVFLERGILVGSQVGDWLREGEANSDRGKKEMVGVSSTEKQGHHDRLAKEGARTSRGARMVPVLR